MSVHSPSPRHPLLADLLMVMVRANTDHNLLFGILALQMEFVSREALIAAMHGWVLEKAKPLGEMLVRQGALSRERRAMLDMLVQEHLNKHDGDVERSLAAISSIESVRDDLDRLADSDVQASLQYVAVDHGLGDRFATQAPSLVGASSNARFRILRPHAKGGLGEVFVAHDEELHREVALKQIQPRHADHPESRARFVMEAEITGGLEHPGIVPVYGLGAHGDERPYYAMRFIKGDSLRDAIEHFHQADADSGERTLELRKLLRRLLDVCNAMAYAHSRGVLHRDLKPSNIMLGKYGETLVVDWGLAKAMDQLEEDRSEERPLLPSSGSGSAATMMGSAVGTPAYMSPEQAAGRLNELGPASDVYSLGATLYCLLTGKPPLEGDDLGLVLQKSQRGEITPPRQVKASAPPCLEAICLKAMALRPEDRYASARELASDIESWLADEPVAVYREPPRMRMRRWVKRHRSLAGAGALATLLPIALLGWYTYHVASRSVSKLVHSNNESASRIAAELVRDELQSSLYAAQMIAALPGMADAVRNRDAESVRDRLRIAVRTNPRIDRAYVCDKSGEVWSDYPHQPATMGQDISHRADFADLARDWKPCISEVFQRLAEPRLMVVGIAAPILDEEQRVLGGVIYQFRLEEITQWMRQIELGERGYVYVLDHEATVAAHPRLDLQARRYEEYAQAEPIQLALLGGEARSAEYVDPICKQNMMATFTPVDVGHQRWIVAAQQPTAEAYASLRQMASQISIAVAVLAFAAVFWWW